MSNNSSGWQFYLLAASQIATVLILGYFVVREDFSTVLGLFSIAFAGTIWAAKLKGLTSKQVFWLGLILRIVLIGSVPFLSDDFARFLWDGEFLGMGINPYLFTPNQWITENASQAPEIISDLLILLNSPDYFSIYPPTNQLIFWIAGLFMSEEILSGIIALRVMLILGEIGVFLVLRKILKKWDIPESRLIWYWLNPFIILEITGSLHFEGLVLLLLLLAIYFLIKNRNLFAGSFLGLSVAVKLVPLILLPAIFFNQRISAKGKFLIGFALAILIGFFPLAFEGTFWKFLESVRLYQGKFEFNASIYYVFREVGFWIKGYNTIATLTKILSLLTLASIVWFSWKNREKPLRESLTLWLIAYIIYLFLQPVVHPWYLIPAFGISLFTNSKVLLVWTFTAIFSYAAYSYAEVIERPIFLILEYVPIFLILIQEVRSGKLLPIHKTESLS